MSRKKPGVPWTSQTAPRQGSKPGRKPRLSAQAMQILDRLLVDFAKHGAATLKTLRIERPELYAKLALDVASKVVLNDAEIGDSRPMRLTVRWIDAKSPPPALPPDPIPSELPARGPMVMPKLLSFDRNLDQ